MSPRDIARDDSTILQPPHAPPRLPSIWLLTLLTGAGPFTLQVLMPSLPLLAQSFAVPYSAAQLSLTVYLIGIAVGQLIYGPLSDRFGRRPLLLGGLAIYLVGSVAATLAPSMGLLVVARAAQAAGACAGMVMTRAMVRDVFPANQAASKIGFIMMGMTVAPMMAPLVGAELQVLAGWRASMLACVVIGLVLPLLVLRYLGETLREPQPLPGIFGILGAYARLFANPVFCCYTLVTAFSSGVFFAFMAGAPLVLVEGLGHTPRTYAIAFMVVSLSFALGSFLAGRFSGRLGVRLMLQIGLILTTIGAMLSLFTLWLLPLSLVMFFLPMLLMGVGNGISQPNSLAAAISVQPKLAGTASGVVGAAQMGVGALMTLMTGVLEIGTGFGTALVMAACAILSQLGLAWAQRLGEA
ncbi:multidrug effflux MFS transporter [Roseomonas marmotae]|uniref:Bcr/CflA family efflux transporter n=1 Tax=Roseomonas marmotae TaxID=2768161 RepID=A0ABS3KEA6_9PROT|nr:multidrug effflux MFS transporter [Roseomonas marmotae]MBO1075765.1 multidrug effflux MFS transporter [Roseomonas marmotae]QTI80492.1 multidrug effflux MFS transporter [Roseomonas marmotae]